MAKNSTPAPGARWRALALGLILGFGWGSLMWGFATLIGQQTGGVRGWLYIAISMAMIGGGVAAVFGASAARRRGERVAPRIRKR